MTMKQVSMKWAKWAMRNMIFCFEQHQAWCAYNINTVLWSSRKMLRISKMTDAAVFFSSLLYRCLHRRGRACCSCRKTVIDQVGHHTNFKWRPFRIGRTIFREIFCKKSYRFPARLLLPTQDKGSMSTRAYTGQLRSLDTKPATRRSPNWRLKHFQLTPSSQQSLALSQEFRRVGNVE